MLATAVVALAGGGVAAVAGDALLPPLMGLDALLFAFLAGRMKSEHDRLEGRPGLWHKHPRRPRGR